MRIALTQINPIVGDIAGNAAKIIAAIQAAKAGGAELVLFSELALCGYPPEDLLLQGSFVHAAAEALAAIAAATSSIAAVVGLPRFVEAPTAEKMLANSAAVIANGTILGFHDKMLLPTYDVFDERRYFSPSAKPVRLWRLGGYNVGVTICEDIWHHSGAVTQTSYQRDPVGELAALHPDIVLNLSASPFHRGKGAVRRRVCQSAAQALGCPLFLCNQVGGNDGLLFDGRSLMMDSCGRLVVEARSFEEQQLFVDTEQQGAEEEQRVSEGDIADGSSAELFQALVLGLRDYLHKQGFARACLGLSGGIDSALVACIAKEALGKENVLGIAMPSRYSSAASGSDAAQLASNLGIGYKVISIESPFQAYLDLLGPHFFPLPADTSEENIQARIRGMIVMAFANKYGYIVATTGNKSEMALGYATLYGDMCGGVAVLGDLLKTEVYRVAGWINREKELIPYSTMTKAPSAELRFNQYDSDSLPPYDIVDAVIADYVEEGYTVEEIAVRRGFSMVLVHKLVQMIHRSEFKRRQAAPALRVTPKAFTLGRRFPIVQRWV